MRLRKYCSSEPGQFVVECRVSPRFDVRVSSETSGKKRKERGRNIFLGHSSTDDGGRKLSDERRPRFHPSSPPYSAVQIKVTCPKVA